VTYLIVGLDRQSLTPWHQNIQARDPTIATRVALDRAQSRGVDLVVAAVIGPHSRIVLIPEDERAMAVWVP
jgi:hypothetical protein